MARQRRKYFVAKKNVAESLNKPEGFGVIDWKQADKCVCGKSFYIKDGDCTVCKRKRA